MSRTLISAFVLAVLSALAALVSLGIESARADTAAPPLKHYTVTDYPPFSCRGVEKPVRVSIGRRFVNRRVFRAWATQTWGTTGCASLSWRCRLPGRSWASARLRRIAQFIFPDPGEVHFLVRRSKTKGDCKVRLVVKSGDPLAGGAIE